LISLDAHRKHFEFYVTVSVNSNIEFSDSINLLEYQISFLAYTKYFRNFTIVKLLNRKKNFELKFELFKVILAIITEKSKSPTKYIY
jgi:hypothetical protein